MLSQELSPELSSELSSAWPRLEEMPTKSSGRAAGGEETPEAGRAKGEGETAETADRERGGVHQEEGHSRSRG